MIKVYYAKLEELTNNCNTCKDCECFLYETTEISYRCPIEKLLNQVNSQRRKKVFRCKNKKDKMRSLLTGLLLRFALEQEQIDYEKSEFSYGKYGKPILSHCVLKDRSIDKNTENSRFVSQTVCFSLTHSANYVACAISNNNIGIDLEETERKLFIYHFYPLISSFLLPLHPIYQTLSKVLLV